MTDFFRKIKHLGSDSPDSSPENSPKHHTGARTGLTGETVLPPGSTTGYSSTYGSGTAMGTGVPLSNQHHGGFRDKAHDKMEHMKESTRESFEHLKDRMTGHPH